MILQITEVTDQGKKYVDLVWNKLEIWYEKLADFTPNFIVGIVLFFIFYFTSSYFSKLFVKIFHKQFPEKEDTVRSFVGVIRFLFMLIGTFIALEIMGLSGFLWKFIGSLGVAGVIAGVALKDLVSSIFSGMLVGIDKSFAVGDYISIGNYSGTVQDIGFLTTKLLTDDGKKVYIPNQTIFNAPFFNITASPQRRVILNLEIPVSENIETARSSILEAIKSLEHTDKTNPSDVLITDVKNGNFQVQVMFWLMHGANYLSAKSSGIMAINKALAANQIQLVTPTSISINNGNLTETKTAPSNENTAKSSST